MEEKEMRWGEEEFSEGENLESAPAEERDDILERELEQSEQPLKEEQDIGEDDTDAAAVERMGRGASYGRGCGNGPAGQQPGAETAVS